MEVNYIVKWTRGEIGFDGRTFKINRFEFRDMKLVAICKLESGEQPILTHPDGPTMLEAVDYVFELNELEVLH